MHILVVEDEQRLAVLLRRILTRERHSVDLAYDGSTGLDLALSGQYDAIILDLMLPDIDGLEICRRLRIEQHTAPLLMLTARGTVEDRVQGLDTGADDYLTKPFAIKELVARVNALLRRRDHHFQMNMQLTLGNLTLDLVAHEARRDGQLITLTTKEFALLEYFMRHPDQVLTRDQIIAVVWGYDSETLSNVVDNYVHFLRDKIDRGFSPALIKTVRGVGYKMVTPR